MKAKLIFDLPEERQEFTAASNAMALAGAIVELDQWLRNEIKYAGREELQCARDQLRELCVDNEVVALLW